MHNAHNLQAFVSVELLWFDEQAFNRSWIESSIRSLSTYFNHPVITYPAACRHAPIGNRLR